MVKNFIVTLLLIFTSSLMTLQTFSQEFVIADSASGLISSQRYEEAIQYLTSSLPANPNSVVLYRLIGDANRLNQSYETAFEAYKKVIALQDSNISSLDYEQAGKTALALKRNNDAIQYLTKALTLGSTHAKDYLAQTYLSKGEDNFSAGNIHLAKEDFTKGLEYKQDTVFYLRLVSCYEKLNEHDSGNDSVSDPPDFVPVEKQPIPIKQVPPEYPVAARRARINGTVWVKCLVSTDGTIRKAIIMSSDAEIFNEPSIQAALQWEFTPAIMDGKPIAVWAAIPFRFHIDK